MKSLIRSCCCVAVLALAVAGCSTSKDENKDDPKQVQDNKDAMKKYDTPEKKK